ncbi:LPXTG cell wall anchor domain-containing protein [Streptococcus suis]
MNTKKLVKWGVALTSTLVLGGGVAPVGSQLLDVSTIVYAEEQPVTYRIHYYLNDVAENGGVPSDTDIAPYKEGVISKGETIIEVAPHIDGYVVNGANSILITYDHITGDNVWHDKDWYPADGFLYDKVETPAEQPAETPTDKPVETPVEQPAEQPAEQPTEQPVEQPTEQPAGKVQAVTATDKKTVDKSAPSTPAVKPEEASQPVAKTLPKTGDSSSMLLVLGGVLSGLSGLGLAATSRKRD